MRVGKLIWKHVWGLVWDLSEYLKIPLGNFAPWVFSQAIGYKYKRVK